MTWSWVIFVWAGICGSVCLIVNVFLGVWLWLLPVGLTFLFVAFVAMMVNVRNDPPPDY